MKPYLSIGRCASATLMALAIAGCATTLPQYKPAISEVDIPMDEQAGIQMLVSLAAVRADRKTGTPAGVEARIRVQNHTAAPARIQPDSLDLVNAKLESFATPRVSPSTGLDVKPGDRAVMSAFFPYPAGETRRSPALDSLNLRWQVSSGGNIYAHGLSFQRNEPRRTVVYNYPGPYYWGPGWGWGGWWGPPVVIRERDDDHGGDHAHH